jgi:hypothetical protein
LLQTLSYTINPSHSKLFIRSFEPFFSGAGTGWIARWQHGFLHAGLASSMRVWTRPIVRATSPLPFLRA